MIEDPQCPICDARAWEVIGSRTYQRCDIDSADQHHRNRMRVLFEIWHPNTSQVINYALLCGRCGFVAYRPRPTADDLDRKYRFLTPLDADHQCRQVIPKHDVERARRLYRKLSRYGLGRETRVLDFGGADGRLVAPFAEHGCSCFVVDYVSDTIDQVTWIGTTLDDVDPQDRFEMIVCSHVIEHVAEPREILERLSLHLTDGGIMYVEVPMEIWKRPPLHSEPVTHVNFFTVESLTTLLERAGLQPLRTKLENYVHPLGHRTVVVAGTAARINTSRPTVRYFGGEATRRLLNPSLTVRLQREFLSPRDVPGSVYRQLMRCAQRVWGRPRV